MCYAGICEFLYNRTFTEEETGDSVHRLIGSQETEDQEETGDSVHRLTGSQETEGQVGVHDSEYFPFSDDDDNVQGEDEDDQGEYDDDQGKAEYDEGLFLNIEICDEMIPEMGYYHGLLSKVRKIVKFFSLRFKE